MVDHELHAMLDADERHWWYRGRRRVIAAQLDRLLPARRDGFTVLDAGCGSGRNLDVLARYGAASGVDISPHAVAAAHARGHTDVRLGNVENIPFPDDSFDLVTCLDVLEHMPDDRRVLRELRRVTRPGGALLVTAPAYPSLWSAHDVANEHKRRYRRGTLDAAATAAGWSPLSSTHFNSLLLAPAALVRLAERGGDHRGRSDLAASPPGLDRVLEAPLVLEAALVRRGLSLPFGLSVMAVYRDAARVTDDSAPVAGVVRPRAVPVPVPVG
jgi:SAM-dependent methyltransferase